MQPMGQISPDGRWAWNGAQWIPNQAPPMPSAPAWAKPYESAAPRARWAAALVIASAAAAALTSVANVFTVDLPPSGLGDASNAGIALLTLALIVAFFASFIAAIVLFCMWLHRVIRNMPALGSPDPRWSPSGAVIRCFIPILSFLHPLYGTLDAWRGSDHSTRYVLVDLRKQIRFPGVMQAWWALWIIGNFVGRYAAQQTGGIGAVLDLVNGAMFMGAGILAVIVMRQVTARQELKQQLIASGQLR